MEQRNTVQHFNALIISPDLDDRMRLRQATSAVPLFRNVTQAHSLREADGHLRGREERCDVLFVSHTFDADEISTFVAASKEIIASRDAAFVLVLTQEGNSSEAVAAYVLHGIDGFLFEPYSVNSLVEITELASKVRKERSEAREKMAFTVLVTQLISQLDVSAFLKSCGYALGRSWRAFCTAAFSLRGLGNESLQNYISIATKMFPEAPAPKFEMLLKKYTGASSRVKKRMEEKLLSEMDEKIAHQAEKDASPKYIVKTDRK